MSLAEKKHFLLLALILLVGFILRIYNTGWDQYQLLHPDERFLLMVTRKVELPTSLRTYLDPQQSPLSPYNNGYRFYVYGDFPLLLIKSAAKVFQYHTYTHLALVGRTLAALFDTGTIFLVYLIAKQFLKKEAALLAALFYSLSVLPIQLSHFFTVDPFLNFFLTLSFLVLIRVSKVENLRPIHFGFLGLTYGLSLACKASAVIFAPLIGVAFLKPFLNKTSLTRVLLAGLFFLSSLYLASRLFQPTKFAQASWLNPSIHPLFIQNLKELGSHTDPATTPPPGIQWINTLPLIFPIKNMLLWGLGLPLGLLSLGGIILGTRTAFRKESSPALRLILLWTYLLILYQGTKFVKTMRYFLPLYPFLVIFAATALTTLTQKLSTAKRHAAIILAILLIVVWPFSFLSIYRQPHTRVQASQWIYQNIPAGDYLANEHWDDALPLHLDKYQREKYQIKQLPFFNRDNETKWQQLIEELEKADYLVLSSSRLYASITNATQRYPIASQYYQALFDGRLGASPVHVEVSYPRLPLPLTKNCWVFAPLGRTSWEEDLIDPLVRQNACDSFSGIVINDDASEEAFTVYDHPKVIIFDLTNFDPAAARKILLHE